MPIFDLIKKNFKAWKRIYNKKQKKNNPLPKEIWIFNAEIFAIDLALDLLSRNSIIEYVTVIHNQS